MLSECICGISIRTLAAGGGQPSCDTVVTRGSWSFVLGVACWICLTSEQLCCLFPPKTKLPLNRGGSLVQVTPGTAS